MMPHNRIARVPVLIPFEFACVKNYVHFRLWNFSPCSLEQNAARMHRIMNMLRVVTFKPQFEPTFFTTLSWTSCAPLNLWLKTIGRIWKPSHVLHSRLSAFLCGLNDCWLRFRAHLSSLSQKLDEFDLIARGLPRHSAIAAGASSQALPVSALHWRSDRLVLCEIASIALGHIRKKKAQMDATINWQCAHVSCGMKLNMCKSCNHMYVVRDPFVEMSAICCAVLTYLSGIAVSSWILSNIQSKSTRRNSGTRVIA